MKNRIDYLFDGVAIAFSAVQTELIFQIISLIISILATIISLSFTIYMWWKKAKEDGKITKEELDELKELTKDDVNDLKEEIKDIKKEK